MATSTRPPGVGVLATLEGAGLIAWHLSEHQHPEVGQNLYLHPTTPPMRIEIVDPAPHPRPQ